MRTAVWLLRGEFDSRSPVSPVGQHKARARGGTVHEIGPTAAEVMAFSSGGEREYGDQNRYNLSRTRSTMLPVPNREIAVQQQTDFAIIPDAEDIAKIDRQIGFVPTLNPNPKVLSPGDIDRWNADGYLSPLTVLEPAEADSLREYFDRLLDEALAEGRDSYSISSAHLKHARIYDLLAHPTLVAIISDLLGDDIIGWGAHFFCKLPGDGKRVDWHQDCSYWPLTPTKSVTAWLAIDDADEENGCMEVVAGSHRFGLIEYEASEAKSGNVLNQTVRNPEQYGRIERTPVRAGQMSLHSDLLLHGSPPNDSPRRRCGLTLRYCPADVRAHLNWNLKGRLVTGRADADAWPGARRPAPM